MFIISVLPLATVLGNVPRVVTLLYFRGVPDDRAVRLEWATGTELDTAGFYIDRATSSGGPYNRLDQIGFIPSAAPPDGLSGATYEVEDHFGLINEQTYWYILVEIQSDGSEHPTSPISVVPSDNPLPSTSTSTATSIATSTSQNLGLTPSATATSTSVAQVQVTPQPTSLTAVVTPTSTRIGSRQSSLLDNPSNLATTRLGTNTAGDNSGGIVAALSAQADATGYPAPLTPNPVSPGINSENGYPINIPQPDILPSDAYPGLVSNGGQSDDSIAPLGSSPASGSTELDEAGDQTTPNQSSEDSVLSTAVLWLGFIASLVIFLAGVVGSIYYYRRPRSQK